MADLKAFAKPYAVTDGALAGVTLWMMPYRTITVERVIVELNTIEPEVTYVHPDGRRRHDEPDDLKAERERIADARQKLIDNAAKLKVEPNAEKLAKLVVRTDWQRVYNWGVEHQAFWKYEPLLVAVDFPDIDERSPAELVSFERYMRTRASDTADRWEVFRAVMGTETVNTLYYAYEATRDRSFEPTRAANTEGGTDGNSPLSDGAPTTESSS